MNHLQRYTKYLSIRLSAFFSTHTRGRNRYVIPHSLFVTFLTVISFSAIAQTTDVTLTGRVTDVKTNEPLPGVVVHIKGTTHQVLTDERGYFTFITGQRVPVTYELSYVGFKSKDIVARDYKEIQISLEGSNTSLGEVVVVGYGTQRKSELTGSIASVPKSLLSVPATSFENLLQGCVSGVSLAHSSGQPGSTATVRYGGAIQSLSEMTPCM